MNKNTYVINLWGLGDLIPTLENFARFNLKIKLVTLQDEKVVSEILRLLKKENDIEVISMGRYGTSIYLFLKALNGADLIFSAPLAGKARKLATFLNKFSKKIYLVEEEGNIYELNSEILKRLQS
ncbi:MAG: hypothetical protein CMD08_03710 [Flavobacteriales bacterium]|nr:hypothetical protein [Flavobacteriales bacterium]